MPSILDLFLVTLLSPSAVMASTPVQPREAIPLPEPAATDKVKRVSPISVQ